MALASDSKSAHAVKSGDDDVRGVHPMTAQAAGAGNVDQIRDILFGSQMRDYEERFARLEQRLMKESHALREDVKRRLEQLERANRKELEALAQGIKSEQHGRIAADQEFTREVRELAKSTEKTVAQLDEQAAKAGRDLRQQMLDQAKRFSEETRQKFDELATMVDHEVRELRGDKTDRAALAALLSEMAGRLTNGPSSPQG